MLLPPLSLLLLLLCSASHAADVLLSIICQQNAVSQEKCQSTIDTVGRNENVRILEDFQGDGDWTIFPIIPRLLTELKNEKWIFFASEHTSINAEKLLEALSNYNYDEDIFLGHALTDPEPTIIHHFAPSHLKYPLLPAGFAFSRVLFKRLAATMEAETSYQTSDFSIDASYELANYIWDYLKISLTNYEAFCTHPSKSCATSINVHSKQMFPIEASQVTFAVKTCEKFHYDRIPAVQSTWGSRCQHITFYSDAKDDSIPTVRLDVEHTHQGHCEKTRGIIADLKAQFKSNRKLKWAVITDDDTILSVGRIVDLVRQYNSSEPLAIGERYGYNLQNAAGYNYLTGGGGVILSRAAVYSFKSNSCLCPSSSTPDDMFLFGVCLKRLRIALVHTPLIHQARPNDYSEDLLSIGTPVSFHKHWMLDPVQVYEKWFNEDEQTGRHRQEL